MERQNCALQYKLGLLNLLKRTLIVIQQQAIFLLMRDYPFILKMVKQFVILPRFLITTALKIFSLWRSISSNGSLLAVPKMTRPFFGKKIS